MSRRKNAGFSLIELMVVVVIVAIIAAFAFPDLRETINSNRSATASNELLAGLTLARSEAIRGTRGAGICASPDGASCTGAWNAGWMVWTDLNGNGSFDAGGDTVVRWNRGNANLLITTPSAAGLLFDNRGRATGVTAAGGLLAGAQTLTVRPAECNAGSQLQRAVVVNVTGQVRIAREACA